MHEVPFISIPENPVPKGGRCFHFQTPDDACLRVATFPAHQPDDARATVVLLSGRSEFIEKYFEVISELQERGFNVITKDWRGQGLSSRLLPIAEKGHITDFDTFGADLRLVIDAFAQQFEMAPLLIMTHSMGSVPALQVLARNEVSAVGAILSAPMTRLFANPLKRAYVRATARTASALGMSRQSVPGVKEHSLKFEGNVLTTDAERHARFRALQAAAPNAMIGSPTFGWVKAATTAIDQIHNANYMEPLATPVLIVSAGRDMLIDSTDHPGLAASHPMIDCVTIPEAYHEILMERDPVRDQYWRHFDQFADRILGTRKGQNV